MRVSLYFYYYWKKKKTVIARARGDLCAVVTCYGKRPGAISENGKFNNKNKSNTERARARVAAAAVR